MDISIWIVCLLFMSLSHDCLYFELTGYVQGADIDKLWWEIHKQDMAGNSTFLWFLSLTTNVINSFTSCVFYSTKCNLHIYAICVVRSMGVNHLSMSRPLCWSSSVVQLLELYSAYFWRYCRNWLSFTALKMYPWHLKMVYCKLDILLKMASCKVTTIENDDNWKWAFELCEGSQLQSDDNDRKLGVVGLFWLGSNLQGASLVQRERVRDREQERERLGQYICILPYVKHMCCSPAL